MKPLHERRRRSARETFMACRARYEAEYIESVDMSSAATRRGNCLHAAVDGYVRGLFAAKLTDDAELAQAAIAQARTETPGLTFEEWQDCEAVWSRWAPEFRLNLDTFVVTESALPCYDMVLRYDRVEVPAPDTLRIYDAKSHWRIPAQATLEASWQTSMYLAGARRVFPGFIHYQMVYEFMRYGVLSEVIEKSDAELDVIEQAIRENDQAMSDAEDRDVFPATGGKHCQTCGIAEACDQAQGIHSWEKTRESLISHISALGKLRDDMIVWLKHVVDEHGPQRGGGIEWAHRPKTQVQYPVQDVLDTFMQHDVKPPNLMLSASALKSITESKKKYKLVAEDIKALAVVKSHGTTFSGKPIVPDEDEATPEAE